MRERQKKNPLIFLISLLVIVLVPIIFIKSFFSYLVSPVNSNTNPKVFVIKKGESVSEIADRLEKEQLIRSSLAFKIKYKFFSSNRSIEAGDFKLSPSMSVDQIIDTFSRGSIDKWVTLIEGWRVEEMAEELHSKLKIDKAKFITAAKDYEGYLFPDTYLFNPNVTVEGIISILRNNFDLKYSQDLKRKIKAKGLAEEEGVILASIIEREARSDKARTEIAGILLRRIKLGMGLNADATIQYALGYQPNEKSWWKRHISREDKEIDSPFNTYKYRGLPPRPISNPSLSSLKAVTEADVNTPYLYYYHDSKGNSHYARTIEEHNQNVANNP
ncbi:endolytic transglycosylase MltG [Candidatus Daviesbacteria bacterium]|nr:endolytic transglycosylase MltG [Candidatus Daviesbacteria bacterium]